MTEEEWLACTDLPRMVRSAITRKKVSERKLRLLAAACCRRVWFVLSDECARSAVESAEAFADGECTHAQMFDMWRTVEHARNHARQQREIHGGRHGGPSDLALGAAMGAIDANAGHAACKTPSCCAILNAGIKDRAKHRAREKVAQCSVFLDILGNPFRPITIDPAWHCRHDGIIVKFAQSAYDERALPSGELDRVRLAVLADALEEAGCSCVDIVEHLRSPGPHVRGCWVVDLLLGKE